MATALCSARGVRLTRLRRQILELLWESDKPAGAYDILAALKRKNGRAVGPPTVYRAFEFLIAEGLATRIESRNAYVPSTHPERQSDCLFFICTDCGSSTEVEDPRVERLIASNAAALGYQIARRIVEAGARGEQGRGMGLGPGGTYLRLERA